jgi:ribose transport system substrate-binding protein
MKLRVVSLLSAVALSLIALVHLAGCESRESSTTTTTAPSSSSGSSGKPRVALVMKSLANEFFKTMQDGAEAHHAAHANDYDLLTTGIKNETDVDQQIALVEQMAAQHVDAIVIAPADSKALVPPARRLRMRNRRRQHRQPARRRRAEGKVVHRPFVGPNNMKGARLAGDYLAKKLSKGDAVAIIDGQPGAFNAVQRHDGFEAAMKEAGMNIVTSQSAQWESDKATPLVASILSSHPEIKAFLCANDSMCLGAHTALKDAKKLKQIQLVGFDNIAAVQELVKKRRRALHGRPARGPDRGERRRVRAADPQIALDAGGQGDGGRPRDGGHAVAEEVIPLPARAVSLLSCRNLTKSYAGVTVLARCRLRPRGRGGARAGRRRTARASRRSAASSAASRHPIQARCSSPISRTRRDRATRRSRRVCGWSCRS